MEVLKRDTAWFKSDEALNQFNSLQSLEDKVIFMYSYLKTVAKPSFEKDNTLFKLAFLISDTVYKADSLGISNFSDLINPEKNSFLLFILNSKAYMTQEAIYVCLLSILHNMVDVNDKTSWIYDCELLKTRGYLKILEENDAQFVEEYDTTIVSPLPFFFDSEKYSEKEIEQFKYIEYEIYVLFGIGREY